ncbi:MAG: (d)CMP kinase [Clostridia bacterium]|nr:(d)CMP kinase [Clostridia bacterium]
MQIAIDGPSGAGKSTLAKTLAKNLGFIYIDTGAMYRSIGLYALRKGIDIPNEPEKVAAMLDEVQLSIRHIDGTQHIFLNGEDVSEEIRKPEVSIAASNVAVLPAVRLKLVDLQRMLANKNNVIMDGRDIGTYVLPDAEVKIFLTASVEDRAQRRFEELQQKGTKTTYEEVLKDMKFRDKNDSSRDFAPLKPAEDAELMDTTGNTLEQSVKQMAELVHKKMNEEKKA